VRPLIDSAPFARDPEVLRARAAEHGYLALRGIPGPEAVAPLRRLIQGVAASLGLLQRRVGRTAPLVRPGAALTGTGYDDPRWLALQERVLADRRFVAVGDCAALLTVLETLFGGPVLTRRGDIVRLALPGAPHLTTPPHQDHWYTGGTSNLWTAWIALTETPLELGPLAVLPGSHVSGLLPHAGQGAGRQGVAVTGDGRFAAAPLAAGDAILFNCLTVHCALPNETRRQVRLSVDYRYQPANEPIHVLRVDGTRAGDDEDRRARDGVRR
jgi:ectoine hydroxylase-related dioxygenase (phytanoyl-CoA dioxygenase family)